MYLVEVCAGLDEANMTAEEIVYASGKTEF